MPLQCRLGWARVWGGGDVLVWAGELRHASTAGNHQQAQKDLGHSPSLLPAAGGPHSDCVQHNWGHPWCRVTYPQLAGFSPHSGTPGLAEQHVLRHVHSRNITPQAFRCGPINLPQHRV